jgi:iron complex outermembrane receptor protein
MRSDIARCGLAALLALGASAPATAGDQVDEEIEIKAERLRTERELDDREALEELLRTPAGVALVPAEQIEQTRAFGFEDALGAVPGVLVRSRGLGEEPRISIRGSGLRSNFHTRGVSVLIDGFPFQNADGFSDVESFEFLAARRVEVYKGASSLRYGGDALGGAIQLVTHTGRDAPPLRVRSEGGGYGFFRGLASGGAASGPWDGFFAVSHTQQDGYRDHSEQDRQRFYGSLGRQLAEGASLRVDVNAVRSRVDLPGALTRDELGRDPRQANPQSDAQDEARDFDFGRLALALVAPLSESVRLEWLNQTHHQDLWHPLAFGIIDNSTWNASSELRVVGEHTLLERDGRLSAGLQAAWTRQPQQIHQNLGDAERGPTFSDITGKATNAALYAVEELQLGSAWSLTAGARAQRARREIDDHTSGDGDAESYFWLSPSIGAIWRFAPGRQLYANTGRVEEIPVLFELAAPGNLGGDLSELDPQRAWQFELGTRGELGDRLTWDVSVYDMELRDELRNVNVEPFPNAGFTIPRYENIDRSRHWGADVSAALRLTGELNWNTSYTLSRFVFVDDPAFGSNELPGAPRHFVRSELRWAHGPFWIAPAVEVTPTSYYVDSANTVKTPGYALVHLRLGYEHERSGITARVELRNLADREHVSSVVVDDANGRFFEPGDGRALYAGIDWKWR